MKSEQEDQTVFVGLSGGVDSSVAATRLIQQGYNVVGVFIKVWHPTWMVCNWEAERLDAMRVATHLNIPFLTCDAVDAYRADVANYFIQEYQAGRTPNPDVMCNQYVKFGRFMEFAKERGADYIATGHYAQKIAGTKGFELHRGVDTDKDQTYFLATLTPKQLGYSLFPIGDTPKDQIRVEAKNLNIPVATKKDSQGICFLGQVDIPDFLSHYFDLIPGDVLNLAGEVIGKHQSALIYTTGQRHGFTISTNNTGRTPYYVRTRDLEANTITVAPFSESIPSTTCTQEQLQNYVLRSVLNVGDKIQYQIRYRQTPIPAIIKEITETYIIVSPKEEVILGASGQTCVLYQGSLCLGGGIVA